MVGEGTRESRYFISVRDTGIGIPDRKLEDLFRSHRRFLYDAAVWWDRPGCVCKRIAEILGGEITVQASRVSEAHYV